jgi:hypothetical protein
MFRACPFPQVTANLQAAPGRQPGPGSAQGSPAVVPDKQTPSATTAA